MLSTNQSNFFWFRQFRVTDQNVSDELDGQMNRERTFALLQTQKKQLIFSPWLFLCTYNNNKEAYFFAFWQKCNLFWGIGVFVCLTLSTNFLLVHSNSSLQQIYIYKLYKLLYIYFFFNELTSISSDFLLKRKVRRSNKFAYLIVVLKGEYRKN